MSYAEFTREPERTRSAEAYIQAIRDLRSEAADEIRHTDPVEEEVPTTNEMLALMAILLIILVAAVAAIW